MDVRELKEKLKAANIKEYDLDDIVHDAADAMAANSNTAGFDEQIEFLMVIAGWTPDEIYEAVMEKK